MRIAPEALAPCAWNTFLARSNPIVLTSVTDASLQVAVNTTTLAPRCRRGASTPSLESSSDPCMGRLMSSDFGRDGSRPDTAIAPDLAEGFLASILGSLVSIAMCAGGTIALLG